MAKNTININLVQPEIEDDIQLTISALSDNFDKIDKEIADKGKKVWIDVREFGVKGDGTTDDGARIQDALSTWGGIKPIYFPNLTFGTTVTIEIPDKTIIIAAKGATIKALPTFIGSPKTVAFEGSLYTNYPVVYANSKSDISIGNLLVDANKVNNTQSNVSCIMFDNCSNLTFERVKTINNKATNGGSFVGGAFFINKGRKAKFIDCEVDGIDGEGLHLRDYVIAIINGGEYQNSSSSVIGTQYGSFISINGVEAHDTEKSVISLNSTDSKVINSNVYNSRTYGGIILGHRTTYATRKPADRSIVSGNHVYNCYAGGVIVQYGNNILIENNQVYNNNGAYAANDVTYMLGGINATNWCDSINVVNNMVHNNNRGIYLAAGKVDQTNSEYTWGKFIVTNNKVSSNKLSGIQLNDCRFGALIESNIIQGNNIENMAARAEITISYDFNLGLTILGAVQIKNNTIGNLTSNSGYQGILLSYSGTASNLTFPIVVDGNHVYNMSSANITNQLGLSNADIKNNYINGNLEEATRVDISGTTSTIDIGYARFVRLTGTGSFNIDTITSKHSVGGEIVIQALNTPTLVDSTNLYLNGNFVMNANDVIVLKWSGGAWLEVCRSTN